MAKTAKKFQGMFVKHDGKKGNAIAIARAMHMEMKNPSDITIHSLKVKIYKQRKLMNAQSEWACDKIEVNDKVEHLYKVFSEQNYQVKK